MRLNRRATIRIWAKTIRVLSFILFPFFVSGVGYVNIVKGLEIQTPWAKWTYVGFWAAALIFIVVAFVLVSRRVNKTIQKLDQDSDYEE